MHVDGGLRVLAGREERVPVAGVDGRQAKVGGDLREADGVTAPLGVATDLGGGQVGVPERDDDERYEGSVGVTAPLLDHVVVVGLHAGQTQVVVGRLVEGLAAEPRHRGKRQRSLDVVGQHVLDPGLGVVATGPHLVVGDGRHCHLVAVEPDGGHMAFVGVHQVLVEPDVAPWRVGHVQFVFVHLGPTDPLHLAQAAALHPGATVAVLRREPGLPQVGRLDDVVVHADDRRDLGGLVR